MKLYKRILEEIDIYKMSIPELLQYIDKLLRGHGSPITKGIMIVGEQDIETPENYKKYNKIYESIRETILKPVFGEYINLFRGTTIESSVHFPVERKVFYYTEDVNMANSYARTKYGDLIERKILIDSIIWTVYNGEYGEFLVDETKNNTPIKILKSYKSPFDPNIIYIGKNAYGYILYYKTGTKSRPEFEEVSNYDSHYVMKLKNEEDVIDYIKKNFKNVTEIKDYADEA